MEAGVPAAHPAGGAHQIPAITNADLPVTVSQRTSTPSPPVLSVLCAQSSLRTSSIHMAHCPPCQAWSLRSLRSQQIQQRPNRRGQNRTIPRRRMQRTSGELGRKPQKMTKRRNQQMPRCMRRKAGFSAKPAICLMPLPRNKDDLV